MMRPNRIVMNKTGQKICITLQNGSGTIGARASSKFTDDEDFEATAVKLGIPEKTLRDAVGAFERGQSEVDLQTLDNTVWMRPIHSSNSIPFFGGDYVEALAEALKADETEMQEPVLFWDDIRSMAALDLDAKEGYEFDDMKLLGLENVPTPVFSWVTKSGGLRFVYHAQDPFTAEEVAAVAYLCLMQTVPNVGIEIKRETRHPAYLAANGMGCGSVVRRLQSFDANHLRRWLQMYSAGDDEVIAWLNEKGLSLGTRYDHERCPIDPAHLSHGQPVMVGDKGIYCFSCEARGVTAGSSRPGFFPYTYLCGTSTSSVVYRCMENAVHWEHAKYILTERLDLADRYATLVYSAGMLLHQWPREVITRVFAVGKNLVRMNDRWCNVNGETYSKDIKPLLATLPACCHLKGDKLVQDKAKLTIFDQTFDLGRYGYPSVQPIYGLQIWGHHIRDPGPTIRAVIQSRELSDDSMVKFRPTYRSLRDEEAAWQIVESVFPGISRPYTKLLIAARGIVEGGMSMPPMIFVTGPTGVGKSLSVFVAASMCGDKNTEVVWTTNTERLRQSIIDARGSFVTFNEVLKESQRQTKNATQAMDFCLNLTPDSVSHYMYVGPVRMGRLPVLVWTDTDLPASVKGDAQLARRIVHVHLTGTVDWEASLKQAGIGHPSAFRVSDQRYAEACNVIVSSVIDEYFRHPTTLEDIAATLDFSRISKSEEAEDSRLELARFFDLVLKAPEATGDDALKWRGRGWKIIRRDLETELRNLWLSICDSPDTFASSRRCTEVDWQKLVKTTQPTIFECRGNSTTGNSTKVAVRFKGTLGSKVKYLVNEELL